MTMITPSYLGETIEYSSLHACRSTLEDPTFGARIASNSFRLMPMIGARDFYWRSLDPIKDRLRGVAPLYSASLTLSMIIVE